MVPLGPLCRLEIGTALGTLSWKPWFGHPKTSDLYVGFLAYEMRGFQPKTSHLGHLGPQPRISMLDFLHMRCEAEA